MKIRQWDETAEKFRKVKDKLGCPIDEGIFETVVALNILGITTTMSCEGHLDHGLPYPWVDTLPQDYDHLCDLLAAFYAGRVIAVDRRIGFMPGRRDGCRIQSQGGGDPQKLSEYQQEMREFAEFLKSLAS